MNKFHFVSLAAAMTLVGVSSGVVVGVEDFSYADGSIDAQAGGSGFNYDNFDGAVTTTTSDWDITGGAPTVASGALVTDNGSAKREYNGNIEGAGSGANDGQDDHERSGAARGAGIVFYRVTMNRSSGAVWSGVSTYDFGAERVFFGVPGGGAATDTIWISEAGVGETLGFISLVDGVAHNMVAVLDFDNDLVGLFVDPDGASDFWDPTNGTNSADVTRAYTGANWSTAARLGSGGATTWDDLTIAMNDPTNVGLLAAAPIPEPATALLGGLALLGLLRRRR